MSVDYRKFCRNASRNWFNDTLSLVLLNLSPTESERIKIQQFYMISKYSCSSQSQIIDL